MADVPKDSGVTILSISFLFEEVVQQVSYLVQPGNKAYLLEVNS
jgi:hypothetical protein